MHQPYDPINQPINPSTRASPGVVRPYSPGTAIREHLLPRLENQAVAKEVVEGLLPAAPDAEGAPAPRWFGVPHAGAYAMGFLLTLYAALLYVKSVVWRLAPVMSKKELKRLSGYSGYVKELSKIREELYKEYFKQLHHSDD